MPYFGIFGLELQKIIVIFEISTLKFVLRESLTHTVTFGKGPGSAFSEGSGPGSDPLYKVCHYYRYSFD